MQSSNRERGEQTHREKETEIVLHYARNAHLYIYCKHSVCFERNALLNHQPIYREKQTIHVCAVMVLSAAAFTFRCIFTTENPKGSVNKTRGLTYVDCVKTYNAYCVWVFFYVFDSLKWVYSTNTLKRTIREPHNMTGKFHVSMHHTNNHAFSFSFNFRLMDESKIIHI